MPDITCFPDANVRSPAYYVARTSLPCPHCGLATRLLALALPQGHEALQEDDSAWQRENADALLFYVESLPGFVQDRLRQLSRSFRLGFDAGANNTYWANHCEHCGTLLGDHELHCEPEGAFLPASEITAGRIQLLPIPEPFAAAATGYACDPAFFAFMPKG